MREIERHKEEELPLDNRAGEHTEKGSKGRNTPLRTVVLLVLLIQVLDSFNALKPNLNGA